MILSLLALVATPLPEAANAQPFHLSVSVVDEGHSDTITSHSAPIAANKVKRLDLRCDAARTFCRRVLDAYVHDGGLMRTVVLQIRDWDGERWSTIATPTVTFTGEDMQAHVETGELSISVMLGERDKPEPYEI
ncbi:hypothetical protein WJS89_11490 [Sphingomicrobium sp. XHP0235]|uniref:hypothetical protein n=1 Tax=Sphingomicrobium aquimarinum TaxID=3133971 RepID=UPI0031FEEF9E